MHKTNLGQHSTQNNEVPPVNSTAEGVSTFKVKENTIKSKINITGITDVSGAQILAGKKGENGNPIIDLLKTGKPIIIVNYGDSNFLSWNSTSTRKKGTIATRYA
jgi:hypothetical protein